MGKQKFVNHGLGWVLLIANAGRFVVGRELAFQIGEQFEALGATIGAKCAVVVGGVDMMQQAIALAKKVWPTLMLHSCKPIATPAFLERGLSLGGHVVTQAHCFHLAAHCGRDAWADS